MIPLVKGDKANELSYINYFEAAIFILCDSYWGGQGFITTIVSISISCYLTFS